MSSGHPITEPEKGDDKGRARRCHIVDIMESKYHEKDPNKIVLPGQGKKKKRELFPAKFVANSPSLQANS